MNPRLQGVIKHVRWQQHSGSSEGGAGAGAGAPDLFVCGGNDSTVRVFDVRRADPAPTLELGGWHTSAVNTVAFASDTPWQILSSGFDGVIRLWDIRAGASQTPLAELAGHHGTHKPTLMHPIFYQGGRSVLTAGQGSPHLFRYDVATSARTIVATLGWTPGTLALHPQDLRHIFAAVGKVGIWLLGMP